MLQPACRASIARSIQAPDSRYLAGPAGIDWRMPSGILNAVRSEWETEFGGFEAGLLSTKGRRR